MATHLLMELVDGPGEDVERYNSVSPWGLNKELDVHRLRQISGYMSDRKVSDLEAEVASLSAKIDRQLSTLRRHAAVNVRPSAGRTLTAA